MLRDAMEEERIETGLQEGGRFRSPPQITGGGREPIKAEKEEREAGSRGWRYDVETENGGPFLGQKETAREERLERGSERRRIVEKGRMEEVQIPMPRP